MIENFIKLTCYQEAPSKLDQTVNKENALCRYQFFEILVRIAKAKYIEFGTETNIASALQMLILNHILPMKNGLIKVSSFRVHHLWCHEVSDLLQVNTQALRRLYDSMAKAQFNHFKNRLLAVNRVFPSIDQIRYVIGEANILNLDEAAILHAFFLSK